MIRPLDGGSLFSLSQDRVEHAEGFDEMPVLPRAPLTQLFKGDKAVLVRIDFLQSVTREKKKRKKEKKVI